MAGEVHEHSQFHRCSTDYQRVVTSLDHTVLDEAGAEAVLADIRSVQRHLDGLVARVAGRVDDLATDGLARPGAEMLRGDGAVSADRARREARRAETGRRFPAAGKALGQGQISGEHLDAIGSLTRDLTDKQITSLDVDAMVEAARTVPVETFRRRWRREVDTIIGDHGHGNAQAQRAACRLRMGYNHTTGMGWLSGDLDPESYERLSNAIQAQMNAICSQSDETTTKNEHLAARALIELLNGDGVGTGRPSISVLIDIGTLTNGPHPNSIIQTENGYDLAPDTVARMLCDADLRRVVTNRSVPIDVGRQHRVATGAQWAAIKAIHSTCAMDGCDGTVSRCQLHHILEWEHGGPTDLANLIPLCSTHHHRVHEGGWMVKLLPDRTLEVFKPNGEHHATQPPPMRC